MEYFAIYKTDKKSASSQPIKLIGGYNFVKKISITLYNRDMVRYILLKKLNNSLKSIINLYLLCEDSEDTDSEANRDILLPKIELMRKLLLERYSLFLNREEVEDYLIKLEKMERKVGNMPTKKSRRM